MNFSDAIHALNPYHANDDTRPVSKPNRSKPKSSKPNLMTSLNRWIKVNGITHSLHQLDDRTLNDIGLSRVEIRAYAKQLVKNGSNRAA